MSSDAITYSSNPLRRVAKRAEIVEFDIDRDLPVPNEENYKSAQGASGITDEQLLEQMGGGTREALAVLFRRHAQAIQSIAQRILRDSSEADDLLQDIFLFIFRKAALFDRAKGSGRSWIMQVAYHRAFNRRHYLTARQHYQALQLDEEILDPRAFGLEPHNGPSPIDAIFGQELLAKCKTQLSPEQMQTIELFFFEGYTLKEIAELTGQSLSNVRSYYYRGLERLRKFVMLDKAQCK